MSRVKIKVGDSFLDTLSDLDDLFYVTSQLYDVFNLEKRTSPFTRNINIPASAKNRTTLGLITNEPFSNDAFNCLLSVDNINFQIAKLLILEETDSLISIVIFSGNFELFDLIPDSSIKDLQLSAYNIPWTIAQMQISNTATEGVIIAQTEYLDQESIDDGSGIPIVLNGAVTDIKNYGFSFYYKTLVKEIIEQSGYSFDDSLINAIDDYDNLVIACPVIVKGTTETTIAAKVELFADDFEYDAILELGVPKRIDFDLVVSDPSSMWSGTLFEYTIPTTGDWRIVFDYVIEYLRAGNNTSCNIIVYKGLDTITTKTYTATVNNFNDSIDVAFNANAGQKIFIEVDAGFQGSNYDYVAIRIGSSFRLLEDKFDPNELNVVDFLPDISQKRALIEFCMQMNLIIDSDPFSRSCKLYSWDYMTQQTPVDITNSLDISSEIIKERSLQGYYRQSIMSYDNESSRTDTDKIVDFSFDASLPLSGNILSSIFSGSDGDIMNVPAGIFNYNSVQNFSITAATNIFTFANAEEFKPGDYVRYGTGVNERIDRIQFVISKISGQFYVNSPASHANIDVQIIKVSEADLRPRIGLLLRSTTFSPQLSINTYSNGTNVTLYRLQFTNTMDYIYENHYKKLFDALRAHNVLYVWMRFSAIDFYNVDPSKPVYIKEFNGSYFINIIEQWKVNNLCRVKLIRTNVLI